MPARKSSNGVLSLGTTFILKEVHARITRGTSPDAVDLPGLRAERETFAAQLREAAFTARSSNDPAVRAAKKAIAKLNQQIDAINAATIYDQLKSVGHSLFAMLAGLIGGTVAAWFYARREPAEAAGQADA
jgi:hypothetical protein